MSLSHWLVNLRLDLPLGIERSRKIDALTAAHGLYEAGRKNYLMAYATALYNARYIQNSVPAYIAISKAITEHGAVSFDKKDARTLEIIARHFLWLARNVAISSDMYFDTAREVCNLGMELAEENLATSRYIYASLWITYADILGWNTKTVGHLRSAEVFAYTISEKHNKLEIYERLAIGYLNHLRILSVIRCMRAITSLKALAETAVPII